MLWPSFAGFMGASDCSFVCRRGYSVTDAQDLTQDFFLMVLKGDLMRQADRDQGKFRSLLLKTLQNFLIDAHIKSRTRKRGGEVQVISWDEWMAEAPSRLTIPSAAMENWPAERIYDVRWAATSRKKRSTPCRRNAKNVDAAGYLTS